VIQFYFYLAFLKIGTPNRNALSRKSIKQREPDSATPREDPEYDEEDEDIHSDDEFSFVEDQKNYAPTEKSLTSSPNFSVRIGNNQGKGEVTSIGAGSFANQIPELGDTDFVQLMEDFKGFGTSPSVSVPDPPDVSAVLITGSISKELDKTEDATVATSETTKLENGDLLNGSLMNSDNATTKDGSSVPNVNNTAGLATGSSALGVQSAEFRERVPSTGQYVKLSDAQKEAKVIGESIDATKNADRKKTIPDASGNDVKAVGDALDAAFDADLDDAESKPSGNDVTADNLTTSPLEYTYVMFNNSPPNKTKGYDSDSDNNESITKRHDSCSVFSAASCEVTSPSEVKKVTNLKSRLKYPVLLVTAGEGHLDQRRKKQEAKSAEPRIMIWQIN
jgi:hypothetical protein